VRAEIVSVGTELLLGQIANTNARWMSQELGVIGVDVVFHTVVGDNLERMVEVIVRALERADVVLVTGGLGPTADDITREAIARVLDAPLERQPALETLLREKFARYGRGDMPLSNLRQADVPRGVRYLRPERGTAPGLAAELEDGRRLYAFAGVPVEMQEMMTDVVLPEVAALAGPGALVSREIKTVGIGESAMAEVLQDLFEASSNPSVAYLAGFGEARVRLTAKASGRAEAEALLMPLVEEIEARLGDVVYATDGSSLEETVIRLATAQGVRLAAGESLTGGGVGERLTSVPGASAAFVGSAVVYSAEAKTAVLGVDPATLEAHGVVSAACAREMAAGARRVFDADVAVGLTGVTGPGAHGGAEPGTVWLALDADGVRHVRGYVSRGERDRVRRWAQQGALDLLRRHLAGVPLPPSDLEV
jgi:nicotinamide-nucleotide amidase